ncbi:hypothetical protein [Ralstonia phage RP31]|uniref:Uncharacterized protein n=2 Tax=Ripduovirus RP12 TaxID=2560700 RepID=A0A1L7N115_9CAUD|nr:hypothetical protein FDH28_gp228 [Ralstonia phage RP12]BAW19167.1 hypothetical protein [Ralstonia phage RP12]BAW19453.1 hypothetical protein [Ralstonia phage RP31]
MKKFIASIAALLAFAFTAQAFAQEKIIVATGDRKGGSTYSIMFNELAAVCGNGNWQEQTTTGGIDNKNLLIGNQVNAAIVQADMLEFERRTDASKVANIKTLLALHPEELHFIARADVKKEGGYFGTSLGAKDVQFKTLSDLRGRNVGAVGGSIASASVVAANSGLGFKVLPVANNDQLKAKLLSGELDAILVVGGAPHPMVKTLPASFKILPIPADLVSKLAASKLYFPAKLSYANLNAAGVQSVATQALLVSRVYRSAGMQDKLKSMRACFNAKLGDIQDKTGTHPKWQEVDANNHGGWPWYDL